MTHQPTNGDWAVGDYALCVHDGMVFDCSCGVAHDGRMAPKKGYVGQVAEVSCLALTHGLPCTAPSLGFGGGYTGLARRFVKITPEKADEFDREVIELYTSKPQREEA